MAEFDWPAGWRVVKTDSERAGLGRRLEAELGGKFEAVARRDDRDDVLARDAFGRLVEVHLTWNDDPWPLPKERYLNLADWAAHTDQDEP